MKFGPILLLALCSSLVSASDLQSARKHRDIERDLHKSNTDQVASENELLGSYPSLLWGFDRESRQPFPLKISIWNAGYSSPKAKLLSFPSVNSYVTVNDHRGEILARSSISNSDDGEKLLLSSVWNYQPEEFAGVGKAAAIEGILYAMRYIVSFKDLTRSSYRSPKEFVQFYIKNAEPGLIEAYSTQESMTFFDKLGFELKDPDQKMLSNPNFIGQYKKAIEALDLFLEKYDDMLIEGMEISFDDPLEAEMYDILRSKGWLDLEPGIFDRVRLGTASEMDLKIVKTWISLEESYDHGRYFNADIEDDYQAFIKEHPTADVFDSRPFEKPARDVLKMEQRHFRTFGPRRGMHQNVYFVLNEQKFLEVVEQLM